MAYRHDNSHLLQHAIPDGAADNWNRDEPVEGEEEEEGEEGEGEGEGEGEEGEDGEEGEKAAEEIEDDPY